MLGLPLDAWVLLFFAVGLGLVLEVTFYLGRRRDREGGNTAADPARHPHDGGPA